AGLEKLSPDGAAAARRVWESGETSDADTGWAFRPLQGLRERVGVVGLRGLAPDAEGRVSALLEQGAVALERAQLASAAAENEALRRADRLRSALLNSISHDFRTPLSSVLGSATTLLEFGTDLKPAVRRDLLESIAQDARRLNRYVGDLLDMGRLEAGALKPRRSWTDVREVLDAAAERLGERLGGRTIERDFARDLSKVRTDPVLLEQAVLNILDNAAAYAPQDSRIEIATHEDLANVLITIEDEGPGIPADALDRVFDKFRRLQAPSDRGEGLGLGLSIARGFIEAMGGRIAVVSPVAEGRGSRFLIALPKAVPTAKELL
ncbi:ATP-binding protein, partial [Caulobacter sp. 17J65-9]|uniref:sensor histidine kinase n=1 Tax=Caulobacter sp. 17J65-9 TaxID=2709382 RepID=UPI0013CB8E93